MAPDPGSNKNKVSAALHSLAVLLLSCAWLNVRERYGRATGADTRLREPSALKWVGCVVSLWNPIPKKEKKNKKKKGGAGKATGAVTRFREHRALKSVGRVVSLWTPQ